MKRLFPWFILAWALAARGAVNTGPSGVGSTVNVTNLLNFFATNVSVRIPISARGLANGSSIVTNNGLPFGIDTPGTTTSGIREAWNSVNKGSEYGPGVVDVAFEFPDTDYFFTNSLIFSNNYTTSVRLYGNDILGTRLVYAGTETATNLIWVKGGGNPNTGGSDPTLDLPMHFFARDLTFSSINEGTNVLLCVTNMSAAYIDSCRWVSWRSMTNQSYGSALSVASVANYPGPQGLVGLVIGNVNDHATIINNSYFQGLASGLYLLTDHLMMDTVKFAEVGFANALSANNLFPNTSPFSLGAAFVRRPGLDTHIKGAQVYASRGGMAVLNFGAAQATDEMVLDCFETEGVDYNFASFTPGKVRFYLKDQRIDSVTEQQISTNGAGVYSLSGASQDILTGLYSTGKQTQPSTNIHALQITSGTVATARLGSGTADSTTVLRGDQAWTAISTFQPTFNVNQFGGQSSGTNIISGSKQTNNNFTVTTGGAINFLNGSTGVGSETNFGFIQPGNVSFGGGTTNLVIGTNNLTDTGSRINGVAATNGNLTVPGSLSVTGTVAFSDGVNAATVISNGVIASTRSFTNAGKTQLGGQVILPNSTASGSGINFANGEIYSPSGAMWLRANSGNSSLQIGNNSVVDQIGLGTGSDTWLVKVAAGVIGVSRSAGGSNGSLQSSNVVPTFGVLWQGGAQQTNVYYGSASLNFANQAAIGCNDLTITVTGAALGDPVVLGVPNGSVVNGTAMFSAFVSATDTVTVRYCNLVSGDPAAGTFTVAVQKWK